LKIPIQDGPRVATRPVGTPYAQTNHSTGLEDVAKGVQQLGTGVQQFVVAQQRQDKARKEADLYKADEADLLFGKAINEALYSQNAGFLNQLGERGLDGAPVYESLEKTREEIARTRLVNDEQRQRFQLKGMARLEQTRVLMEKHSHSQRLNLYKNVADGQVQLALDTVAANPADVESAVGKLFVDPEGPPGPSLPVGARAADGGRPGGRGEGPRGGVRHRHPEPPSGEGLGRCGGRLHDVRGEAGAPGDAAQGRHRHAQAGHPGRSRRDEAGGGRTRPGHRPHRRGEGVRRCRHRPGPAA
jgi:hypothetical protein